MLSIECPLRMNGPSMILAELTLSTLLRLSAPIGIATDCWQADVRQFY